MVTVGRGIEIRVRRRGKFSSYNLDDPPWNPSTLWGGFVLFTCVCTTVVASSCLALMYSRHKLPVLWGSMHLTLDLKEINETWLSWFLISFRECHIPAKNEWNTRHVSCKCPCCWSALPVSSLAVRFGRIPKREKQRLLDEMQSYMNSLNESAAIEMDSPPVRDSPPSMEEGNSKEAIGAISRAYRDIFTSSSQERPAKRANVTITTNNNNNNTTHFSQDAIFQQVSSHPTSSQSYQSCPVATQCPVAPNDNQHTFQNVDNNRYTYLVSNQNHDQSNNTTRQGSANHNSVRTAGSTQNQPSCPWKLAPGAKVLVRTGRKLKQNFFNIVFFCLAIN